MISDFLLSMLDQKLIVVVESLHLASDIPLHLETHRTTGLKTLSLKKRGLQFSSSSLYRYHSIDCLAVD
jgi:pyruvate carboxylase